MAAIGSLCKHCVVAGIVVLSIITIAVLAWTQFFI
jgi:hypothetical protein